MSTAQVFSGYYDVCSATGHSSPEYLPKDCPRDYLGYTFPGSFQNYTGYNTSSDSVHNPKVFAEIFGFSNKQNFIAAWRSNSDYQASTLR